MKQQNLFLEEVEEENKNDEPFGAGEPSSSRLIQSPPQRKNTLADEIEEQDALHAKSVSPLIKPTPGKNMFNFGNLVDISKSPSMSPEKNSKDDPQPDSPDEAAVMIRNPGKRRGAGSSPKATATSHLMIDDSQDSPMLAPTAP